MLMHIWQPALHAMYKSYINTFSPPPGFVYPHFLPHPCKISRLTWFCLLSALHKQFYGFVDFCQYFHNFVLRANLFLARVSLYDEMYPRFSSMHSLVLSAPSLPRSILSSNSLVVSFFPKIIVSVTLDHHLQLAKFANFYRYDKLHSRYYKNFWRRSWSII